MGKEVKIYFAEDSEYAEETSILNGSRHDVIVQIGNTLYNPAVYQIETLAQEFNEANVKSRIYEIDPALILVGKVSKEEIIKAVVFLHEGKYFDRLKPIDLQEEYGESFSLFPQLSELSGWKRVY